MNYPNALIYKIKCLDSGKFYIGSTLNNTLKQRLDQHLFSYSKFLKGKFNFITSYKILENGKFKICLLENFPVNNKNELLAREGFHIKRFKDLRSLIVNKYAPGIYKNEQSKKISLERSTKIICECGTEITKRHIKRHRGSKKHNVLIKTKKI